MTSRQIEAARRAIVRHVKRGGKLWIRVFPDKPVTAKPAETRMGGGKGAVDHWVAVVKPGRMIFEMSGVQEEAAREAMRLASHKLPIKTRFVSRAGDGWRDRMKSREIWEMTPEEIQGKLDDAYAEMFNLRFQFSTGQMQNSARLGQMRREIARLNTILRAKQLQTHARAGGRMRERRKGSWSVVC